MHTCCRLPGWFTIHYTIVPSLILVAVALLSLAINVLHNVNTNLLALELHRKILPDWIHSYRRLSEENEKSIDDSVTFLNHSVSYQSTISPTFASTVHCVGENYGPDAWMYRSCQFRNLCIDATTSEFYLFPATEEVALFDELNRKWQHRDWYTVSSISIHKQDVSLGTVYDPWSLSNQKWFPNVITEEVERKKIFAKGYYELSNSAILFPFHPSDTKTLLWNDLFAIYQVLSIFGLEQKEIALLPFPLTDMEPFVTAMLTQFSSATPGSLESTTGLLNTKNVKSSLVCSHSSVAGLAMIALTRQRTDIASERMEILTHAIGRGASQTFFRSFLHQRFNVKSLDIKTKYFTLAAEALTDTNIASLQKTFSKRYNVQSIEMNTHDLSEQVQAVANSAVYVTQLTCPSCVIIAATLLPRGSILVILDEETSTGTFDEKGLVRDLVNTMGQIHVHWLQNFDDILDTITRHIGP